MKFSILADNSIQETKADASENYGFGYLSLIIEAQPFKPFRAINHQTKLMKLTFQGPENLFQVKFCCWRQ